MVFRTFTSLTLCFLLLGINGCKASDDKTESVVKKQHLTRPGPLLLASPAFDDGKMIPMEYTCDGDDSSPALIWNDPPEGTKSFALVCEDPDAPAGTWIHWVIYNIPDSTRTLEMGFTDNAELVSGIRQGRNDFGRIGYGGPCPPPGKPHRYFFKIYALDTLLDLTAGSSRKQLDEVMKDHILTEGYLMGRYKR